MSQMKGAKSANTVSGNIKVTKFKKTKDPPEIATKRDIALIYSIFNNNVDT